ncbi:MAG: CCA tRNA nucleotidyltransferase [Ardenticatenaceae bacterium]
MYDFTELPAPVQRAAQLLHEANEPAWLVGGATRDLFMGQPVKDFDFVIAGDGVKWARRLANTLKGAFVALDTERRVGRVVVRDKGKLLWLDVAAFRGEDDRGEGVSLEEDLRLRDFTINAIALDLLTGDIVDPTGGVADLNARILRATGAQTFYNDPLRILRAVRQHATHNLSITPDTRQAMQRAVQGLTKIAMERVREEWMKLLAPAGAKARVEMLDELGVIALLLPELAACKGITQSPPHSHNVFGHQLLVLHATETLWPWNGRTSIPPEHSEGSSEGRTGASPASSFWRGDLAQFAEPMSKHLQQEMAHDLPRWQLLKHVALLHDIGKPATRSVGKDGRIHFYKHEVVGTDMIRDLMQRMKFSSKCVQYAEQLVLQHMRPLSIAARIPPRNRTIYRFFRDTGNAGPDIALHSIADQRGKAFATDRPEVVAAVTHLLKAYFTQSERFVRPKPLLNGHDVMRIAGVKGPAVGKILEMLREQQAQGNIQSKEEAEKMVREWEE